MRALVCAALAAALAGCRAKRFGPVDPIASAPRLVAAAVVLANAPLARSVRCTGARAETFRELFAACGLAVVSNDAPADVLFVAEDPAHAQPIGDAALKSAPVVVERLDVRGMQAPALEARLLPYARRNATLWMPGAHDWFVVRRAGDVPYADMSDAFGRPGVGALFAEVGCDTVVSVFASYVGTVDDVLPAFRGKLVGDVLPQWFVTREVPRIAWIGWKGVSSAIRRKAMGEVRSLQHVRRQTLEANELSLKGDEKGAVEGWAKALRLNPGEPLLLERLGLLGVNARALRTLGKLSLAVKCYETMARICPGDPLPLREMADCLDGLGQRDLAAKARERAQVLARGHGEK